MLHSTFRVDIHFKRLLSTSGFSAFQKGDIHVVWSGAWKRVHNFRLYLCISLDYRSWWDEKSKASKTDCYTALLKVASETSGWVHSRTTIAVVVVVVVWMILLNWYLLSSTFFPAPLPASRHRGGQPSGNRGGPVFRQEYTSRSAPLLEPPNQLSRS